MRKPLYKLRAKSSQQQPELVAVLEADRNIVKFYPFSPEKRREDIQQMSFHAFSEKYVLHGFQK